MIIQTWLGFGLAVIRLLVPALYPAPDADDETLGTIVLQALANNRTFANEAEKSNFYNNEDQGYIDWVNHLCEKLGYKTKCALFKNMMDCGIWLHNGRIEISSRRHVRLEAWDGMKGVEEVILTLDNTPAEIGAGLRLALSRCR